MTNQPLAEKIRPESMKDFVGQKHLVGKGRPITRMIETGKLQSMILWGPPGSGKTTLARLISNEMDAEIFQLSAVSSGKKDIKQVAENAKNRGTLFNKKTILFIDEIHRFNKAQQDTLLPYVEDGTLILIGATTENPGFEVNAPLISRSQLFILKELEDEDIRVIVNKAITNFPGVTFEEKAINHIINTANGDARSAINAIELAATLSKKITLKVAEEALQKKSINYDKSADSHYDTISAFIKSMRGSDPDATLHYLARMIKGGEDPIFIARRMVIFASEDIGNARPTALVLATSCMQAVHMIGMPEAQLILAQTATYLAKCPKSIASTVGIGRAMNDVETMKLDPIPVHLRNPKNKLMKKIGYGKGYIRYAWKEEKESGKKINQKYLPKNLEDMTYYEEDWK